MKVTIKSEETRVVSKAFEVELPFVPGDIVQFDDGGLTVSRVRYMEFVEFENQSILDHYFEILVHMEGTDSMSVFVAKDPAFKPDVKLRAALSEADARSNGFRLKKLSK